MDVLDYGWSWLDACLAATARQARAESKARMIESRVAQHGDEKAWKQAMKD